MKKKPSGAIHAAPLFIGAVALILGVLIYQIDRPAGSTYFLNRLPFPLFSDFNAPGALGRAGQILPGFIHVFSFSLITAGLFASERKGSLIACLFWFGINALFETGQKFGKTLSVFIPQWCDGIPYLESISSYFSRGTFDWLDLLAMAAGAFSAWELLTIIGPSSGKKRD